MIEDVIDGSTNNPVRSNLREKDVRRTRLYERSAISDLRSPVSSYRSIVTPRAIDYEDSKPRAISRRLRVRSLHVYIYL